MGPRANLPNQVELNRERQRVGIYECSPGITRLAQIEGIDMSTPKQLALTETKMLDQLSLTLQFKIISLTAGVGTGRRCQAIIW